MIRIESLVFTLEQLANAPDALLVSVSPFNIYENNVKTDKIGGQAYTCVLPKNGYEKLVIKVPDLPPVISNDAIIENTFITFTGSECKFWRDRSGNFQLSCKAEKAVLVGKGGK